jgi:hypothetical protein
MGVPRRSRRGAHCAPVHRDVTERVATRSLVRVGHPVPPGSRLLGAVAAAPALLPSQAKAGSGCREPAGAACRGPGAAAPRRRVAGLAPTGGAPDAASGGGRIPGRAAESAGISVAGVAVGRARRAVGPRRGGDKGPGACDGGRCWRRLRAGRPVQCLGPVAGSRAWCDNSRRGEAWPHGTASTHWRCARKRGVVSAADISEAGGPPGPADGQ